MYYILLFTATAIFAANVWVIRAAQAGGWAPFFLSCCSYAIASLCALGYISWKKSPLWKAEIWRPSAKPALVLLAANVALILAVRSTAPERIGFILGLTVLFVPLLQFAFRQVPLPPLIFLCLILAGAGNVLLNYSPGASAGFYWGDLFALATTLGYALSIIWIRDCSALNIPAESFVFIQSSLSFAGYIPIVLLTGSLQNPASLPLFPLFFLGFISFIVGNGLQFAAQKNMPPVAAAIILATSSVLGMLIGVIFFGLKLTAAMAGAAVLFGAASLLGAWSSQGSGGQN